MSSVQNIKEWHELFESIHFSGEPHKAGFYAPTKLEIQMHRQRGELLQKLYAIQDWLDSEYYSGWMKDAYPQAYEQLQAIIKGEQK